MITHDRHQPYKSTLGQRPGQGTSVFRVRFPGASRTVTISPRLHYVPFTDNLVFARASDGGGWVSYMEKAYVVMRGGSHYENLNMGARNPPSVDRVFFDLVGRFTKVEFARNHILFDLGADGRTTSFQTLTNTGLRDILKRANTHPTIATTPSDPATLIGSHTYIVTGLSSAGVAVREMMRNTNATVRLGNLGREFDNILQSARGC